MTWLDRVFHKSKLERQLDSELRFHIEQQTADNIAAGMNADEARRRALAQFGGLEYIKEETRDARRARLIEDLLQDLRYAIRGIRRAPFLSLAVLLALCVGVGLNAAVFSVLDGAWLQPPVQNDPQSFVQAIPSYSGWFDTENLFHGFTVKDYDAILERAKSLTQVAAWNGTGSVDLDGGSAQSGGLVTCNFFDVYGWTPVIGRLFLPRECATPGSGAVVVISEHLWRTRYTSDPRIIGRTIHIDRHPYTVVGVVRSREPVWMKGDMWVPFTMQPHFYNRYDAFSQHPDYPWLTLVGRLKPGYSRANAQAELQTIERQQDRLISGRRTTVQVTNGSMFQNPDERSLGLIVMSLVMGPMILILLVACTNVTMLLLARSSARRSEMAVRLALGAWRGRLLRMLAIEGLLVATVAGTVSVYLALKLPGVFWSFLLRQTGYRALQPDWLVFVYLAIATLIAGCIAGLAPGRESLKVDLITSLKGQDSTTVARSRTLGLLVVAQIAMSFVLVAAGVVFARLQHSITAVDPGFETRQVFVVPLAVSMPPYTPQTATNFYRTVRQSVTQLPAVRSAAFSTVAPFDPAPHDKIRVPGESKGQGWNAVVQEVSTGYFSALGIPIVHGRAFRASDAMQNVSTGVAVVSQAFAAALWNSQDPIGRVVVLPDNSRRLVVGVARDIKSSVFDVPDDPRLYLAQNPSALSGLLLVRFEGSPGSLAPLITKTIRGLDATQMAMPRTLRWMVEEKAQQVRPLTQIILFMAILTLLLALSGVYGTVAFSMSQRTREIGIRMALGASKERVLRSVLAAGLVQTAFGLSVGIILAVPAAFGFRSMVGRSVVFDWGTYLMAALVLTVAALCAYYIPARRAMKVDPMVALRYE